jgi:hypothetical protein
VLRCILASALEPAQRRRNAAELIFVLAGAPNWHVISSRTKPQALPFQARRLGEPDEYITARSVKGL